MSDQRNEPCPNCGTHSTYFFPDKPLETYCYCSFDGETREQIAKEIEAAKEKCPCMDCQSPEYNRVLGIAAAIARGEIE